MNLNQKIELFKADGIPAYNGKINELVRAVNWLAGVRTINGKPVRESDQGPVIDLSPVSSTQNPTPWTIDPTGAPAGWLKLTVLDTVNANLFDCYGWCGSGFNVRPAPWLKDPDGTAAQWVKHQVCVSGQVVNKWFWGTP
jgi:hypothetical protein